MDTLVSRDSSISESFNKFTQKDFIFDTNFFTQELKTFYSICFLSNGFNILKPEMLKMIPYFKEDNKLNNEKRNSFQSNESKNNSNNELKKVYKKCFNNNSFTNEKKDRKENNYLKGFDIDED